MSSRQTSTCSDQHGAVELIDRLVLEDCGQALKVLYVIDGVVVYSGLVQRLFWEQRALAVKSFSNADVVKLAERNGPNFEFKIARVERITRTPRYALWLAHIDRLALTHWRESDYTRKSGAHKPGDSWIESYLEGLTPVETWEMESNAASILMDSPVIAGAAAQVFRHDHISPSSLMR